jgi:NADH-quinone oxidoreductase subunit J
MGAEFLAAVQVLVYIGGILTLIIFGIMFTEGLADRSIQAANKQKGAAFLVSAFILAIMVYGIWQLPLSNNVTIPKIVDAAAIGRVLFLAYVLAFEVLSVILLIALVGAIILARKETK